MSEQDCAGLAAKKEIFYTFSKKGIFKYFSQKSNIHFIACGVAVLSKAF